MRTALVAVFLLSIAGSAAAQHVVPLKPGPLAPGFVALAKSAPDSADIAALERSAYDLFMRGDTAAAKAVLAAKKEIEFMRGAYVRSVRAVIACEKEKLQMIRDQLERMGIKRQQ